jgi:hypothetical protein
VCTRTSTGKHFVSLLALVFGLIAFGQGSAAEKPLVIDLWPGKPADDDGAKIGEENVFYLSDDVYLSQRDVRELQFAKASIATGWAILCNDMGVEPEDIELTVHGRFLRVRGKRRDCCMAPDCRQVHMEIAYSRFERQVELPADLTSLSLQTEFRLGMLLVHVKQEASA